MSITDTDFEWIVGDPLALNRELDGAAGMKMVAMSQPGGLAILLRGIPAEPVDYIFVSVCHRRPGGPDRFTPTATLNPPSGAYSYAAAVFPNVHQVNAVFVHLIRSGAQTTRVAFVVEREQLPETVIGLG